jgi:hypothetical protein
VATESEARGVRNPHAVIEELAKIANDAIRLAQTYARHFDSTLIEERELEVAALRTRVEELTSDDGPLP